MNLQELRQRKANSLTSARAIHDLAVKENREMTAEEKTKYDTEMATVARLNAQIETEEALAEQERTVAATAPANSITQPPSEHGVSAGVLPKPAQRGVRVEVNDPRTFRSIGEQLAAIRGAALSGGRTVDPRLRGISAGPAGMNEATPSEGGFLVQTDFMAEILQHTWMGGEIASRVTKHPISSASNSMKVNAIDERSRQNGYRNGGMASFWANEAGTLSATKPKFRQMSLILNKLTALLYATDEQLADTTFTTSVVSQIVPDELRFRIEDSILNGLGDGQPLGILQSSSLIIQAKDTSQATGTLTYSNVLNMYSRFIASSRDKGVWLANQSIEPQLFALSQQGSAGGLFPVYLPAGGISGKPYGTLFGMPVIMVEQTQVLGTQGDLLLVDLSEYLMVDKGDIQSASSMHVRFLEDEMVYRWTYRCDGQPTWNFPVQPFAKNAPTLSPYVVLAARP